MVLIAAGSFQMGSNDGSSNEKPVHRVQLDAFYIDIHEVTVGQFKQFVEQSGYNYRGDWNVVAKYSPSEQHPMIYVRWYDAMAYAEWVGKRLPTEAEWEYAARGGRQGNHYPWGNEIDKTKAHYDGWDGGNGSTKAVGSYPANSYGLYDMAGNVWELCLDQYDPGYYSKSPDANPLSGHDSIKAVTNNYEGVSRHRVLRGGGWYLNASTLRVPNRYDCHPHNGHNGYGFRCVSSSLPSDAFTISSINFELPSPDHRTSLIKQRQLSGQMKMEQRIQIHKEQPQSQPGKAVGERDYGFEIDPGRGIVHEPSMPKVVGKGGVVRLSFAVKPNGTVYQVKIIENRAGELGSKARIFVSQIIFNKLASNLPQQDDSGEITVRFEQQ